MLEVIVVGQEVHTPDSADPNHWMHLIQEPDSPHDECGKHQYYTNRIGPIGSIEKIENQLKNWFDYVLKPTLSKIDAKLDQPSGQSGADNPILVFTC